MQHGYENADRAGKPGDDYNPLIDDKVQAEWNIPSSWKLRAQMPFGSIVNPAGEKEYMDDKDRFRVFA